MTRSEFIEMIGGAETGGLGSEDARVKALGDGGLAAGRYQQHWSWRLDHWPAWAWYVLELLDRAALREFVREHAGNTARELADLYNLGHRAPDPAYDIRCMTALARLGLAGSVFDEPVKVTG